MSGCARSASERRPSPCSRSGRCWWFGGRIRRTNRLPGPPLFDPCPRGDPGGRENVATSNVPNVDDFELLHAPRSPHLGDVALALPDERARDRRRIGKLAELDVGLVLADDL